LPQWAVLGKAWYHASERVDGVARFDSVVFDAPATGHGFDMLRLPKVITEVAPAGLLRRDAELAWDLLRDPARSAVVLVTLPEELPTNETIELSGRITGELGLAIGCVVLNRVRPALFAPEERELLRPLADSPAPGTDPNQGDADQALAAAAAHAIREDVQLASSTRLRALPAPIIELPEVDAGVSAAALLDTLSRVLRGTRG
jgi:hypothetical protein